METIKVLVGSIESANAFQQDNTQVVEFEGEKLAERTTYGINERSGSLTDTRGTTQTLYKTSDGRYVIHIEQWSKWQGEPNIYSLEEVTAEQLGPNGQYEMLGKEAGFGRPLTLDEALQDDPSWG